MGVREGSKIAPVSPGQESFCEKHAVQKIEINGENICFAWLQEEILYCLYLLQNGS